MIKSLAALFPHLSPIRLVLVEDDKTQIKLLLNI